MFPALYHILSVTLQPALSSLCTSAVLLVVLTLDFVRELKDTMWVELKEQRTSRSRRSDSSPIDFFDSYKCVGSRKAIGKSDDGQHDTILENVPRQYEGHKRTKGKKECRKTANCSYMAAIGHTYHVHIHGLRVRALQKVTRT